MCMRRPIIMYVLKYVSVSYTGELSQDLRMPQSYISGTLLPLLTLYDLYNKLLFSTRW